MASKSKEIFFSIVMVVIMITAVSYNVYSVEYQKIEAVRQAEEDARLERQMLEEIKSQEAREIAGFDREYRILKAEFTAEVSELSEKPYSQISSIDELKEITMQRMDASKELRDELGKMDIPGPLEDYYKFEMEFLESDIDKMTLVLDYYNSGNYSTYDDSDLEELYKNNNLLFLKAQQEMQRVYEEYDLEYLLQE